jgi:hypothetical protein
MESSFRNDLHVKKVEQLDLVGLSYLTNIQFI